MLNHIRTNIERFFGAITVFVHSMYLGRNDTETLCSAINVQSLTAFYVATWSDPQFGDVPTGPIEATLCSQDSQDACNTACEGRRIENKEVWGTTVSSMGVTAAWVLDRKDLPSPNPLHSALTSPVLASERRYRHLDRYDSAGLFSNINLACDSCTICVEQPPGLYHKIQSFSKVASKLRWLFLSLR